MYHRGNFFWISQVCGLFGIAVNTWMLIRYNSVFEPQEKVALWSYIILPAIAVTIQMFVYGLVLLNFVDTVAIIIIFLFLQAAQGRMAAEREMLLTKDRISIMLSQIQPHFLYNTLSVIQDMCHGKAPEAEQVTIEFAEFLRGDLDSLRADMPIPFEKELMHTKSYLSLEGKRFGSRLSVEYDIRAMDFTIPALTIQPIVENAVRHGLMPKYTGGKVKVASYETDDGYKVEIIDDGVGFDPKDLPGDADAHVGIWNVRERLRIMCGGKMDIESSPGRGTKVMISIPKEIMKK